MNYTGLEVEVTDADQRVEIQLLQDGQPIAIIESDSIDISVDNRSIESDTTLVAMALVLMVREMERLEYASIDDGQY